MQQKLTSPDSKICLWFCIKNFFSHLGRIIWRSYVLLVESIMNYMNFADDFRYKMQKNLNTIILNLMRVLQAYTNFSRDSSLIHSEYQHDEESQTMWATGALHKLHFSCCSITYFPKITKQQVTRLIHCKATGKNQPTRFRLLKDSVLHRFRNWSSVKKYGVTF